MGGMGMGSMGGMGMSSETSLMMAFHGNAVMQGPHSQLLLLLPVGLLEQALVPRGHLQEIAQRCQIRIDLGAEVPPKMRQVAFTGPVVANTLAAYFLQERASLYGGMSLAAGPAA